MDSLITLWKQTYLLFDQFKLVICWILAVGITIFMGQYFKPNTSKIVGTIDFYQVTLRSEASALVTQVGVKVGDRVEKGQVLAILANEGLDTEITDIKEQIDLAKAKQKVRKSVELDFHIRNLNSRLSHLEKKRSTLKIIAPVAGFVSEVSIQVGAVKAPFSSLITIDDPATKSIKAYVHENVTDDIAIGRVFRVASWNDRTKFIQARVKSVGERIAPFPKRLQPETMKGQFWGREVILESDSETPFLLGELLILDSGENSFTDVSHLWKGLLK